MPPFSHHITLQQNIRGVFHILCERGLDAVVGDPTELHKYRPAKIVLQMILILSFHELYFIFLLILCKEKSLFS